MNGSMIYYCWFGSCLKDPDLQITLSENLSLKNLVSPHMHNEHATVYISLILDMLIFSKKKHFQASHTVILSAEYCIRCTVLKKFATL